MVNQILEKKLTQFFAEVAQKVSNEQVLKVGNYLSLFLQQICNQDLSKMPNLVTLSTCAIDLTSS